MTGQRGLAAAIPLCRPKSYLLWLLRCACCLPTLGLSVSCDLRQTRKGGRKERTNDDGPWARFRLAAPTARPRENFFSLPETPLPQLWLTHKAALRLRSRHSGRTRTKRGISPANPVAVEVHYGIAFAQTFHSASREFYCRQRPASDAALNSSSQKRVVDKNDEKTIMMMNRERAGSVRTCEAPSARMM